MQNECRECGAKLKIEQTQCPYCGTSVTDADEQLLTQLTTIARKYKEGLAKANKIEIGKILTDSYKWRLSDGGIETLNDKKTLLENVQPDKNFVSYNIHEAELIERENNQAIIHCIQTVTRRSHFEKGKFEPYIERGTINFVHQDGHWLIISENTVTIDENGNEYE
ncbi:MAG: hypothetical protein AAB336_01360 [Acidobacteriota bacterium]